MKKIIYVASYGGMLFSPNDESELVYKIHYLVINPSVCKKIKNTYEFLSSDLDPEIYNNIPLIATVI
jgi:hypothetical protein